VKFRELLLKHSSIIVESSFKVGPEDVYPPSAYKESFSKIVVCTYAEKEGKIYVVVGSVHPDAFERGVDLGLFSPNDFIYRTDLYPRAYLIAGRIFDNSELTQLIDESTPYSIKDYPRLQSNEFDSIYISDLGIYVKPDKDGKYKVVMKQKKTK